MQTWLNLNSITIHVKYNNKREKENKEGEGGLEKNRIMMIISAYLGMAFGP